MTWDELRSEAFGEVGLLPEDFYLMEHEDYWLLKKGFFNKKVNELVYLREAVMLMVAPHLTKPPNPYTVWPLPGDEERRQMQKEYRKNISVSDKTLSRLAMMMNNEVRYEKVGNKVVEIIVPKKSKDN